MCLTITKILLLLTLPFAATTLHDSAVKTLNIGKFKSTTMSDMLVGGWSASSDIFLLLFMAPSAASSQQNSFRTSVCNE